MNERVDRLLDILEEEKELYRSLLAVCQDEERALIRTNLKELNEKSKKKENLILKVRILEEQRLHVLKRIDDSLGGRAPHATLLELSQMLDEPYSSRLEEYHSDLSSLIQSITEINLTNKDLITHSVGLVKDSMLFLNNFITMSPIYYRTGKIHHSEGSGFVLSGKI
ncbi:MAG: flagellar protein FlgN [Deltaproteobacteria bacterium]|nr:flagellar protein FlgN [Deltaproteobacteria bacterium]